MSTELTLDVIEQAIAGKAAAFRCRRRLQPAGGPGDKVFPPTYAGAVYAAEQRRIVHDDGTHEVVPCVLLDSVQSQANRMEEALQERFDLGEVDIPVVEVDFTAANLIDPIGKVTSLQVPHRLADAILRDSEHEGRPFRKSGVGQQIDRASLHNATPLYRLCPTALVFGLWDSTGPKGGLGVKFERAVVSEVVGVDTEYGVRTSSRIDPLGIQLQAGPLYRAGQSGWTLDPSEAVKSGSKLVLYGKKGGKDVLVDPPKSDETPGKYPEQGKPSVANHGNVTPSFAKYSNGAEGPDPLARREINLAVRASGSDKNFDTFHSAQTSARDARENNIAAGGVTVRYAEQFTTLSLIGLRRLRFPLNGDKRNVDVDCAAHTVLAALGLCAATLAAEKGLDLRSRCLLWPDGPMIWELLDTPGKAPKPYQLDGKSAIKLLKDAVSAAEEAGLTWHTKPLTLTPSAQLVELVRRSQEQAVQESGEEVGE